MAKVPVITSPCPLRFKTAPQPGMDFCGQCQRRVHNLDGMNDVQRVAFFAGCSSEKVCVSYTVKRTVAAVAASVLVGGAALAADSGINPPELIKTPSPACPVDPEYVIVGGTTA